MNLKKLITKACEANSVTKKDLYSNSKKRDLSDTRMIIAAKLRNEGLTFQTIGEILRRSPASVIGMVRNYENAKDAGWLTEKQREFMTLPLRYSLTVEIVSLPKGREITEKVIGKKAIIERRLRGLYDLLLEKNPYYERLVLIPKECVKIIRHE